MAVGARTGGHSVGIFLYTQNGILWNEGTADPVNVMYDVKCQSQNVCWMVGVSGTIGYVAFGAALAYVTSGSTQTLYAMDWVSGTLVYAVGNGGTVLRSADSGLNWLSLNLGLTDRLYDVSFYSDQLNGCIVGENVVLSTFDGGTTWSNLGGSGHSYRAVDMKNFDEGANNFDNYVVIAGMQLRTHLTYTAPTRRRRLGPVYGDPVTYYKGKKTEFVLPLDEQTLMLRTPDMHVFATPLQGRHGDEQWIGSIMVTSPEGDLVVQIDIKNDIVERIAAAAVSQNITGDGFETLDVRMAPRGSLPLQKVPPADQYYTHPSGVHVLFGRTKKPAKETPRREGVVVHGGYAKLHVMSTSAWEFYGQTSDAYKYAHLDFEVFDMRKQETFDGLLAELWGITTMSNETAAMIKPEKDEDAEDGEEDEPVVEQTQEEIVA